MVSLTIRKQQFANELQNVGIESPYQPPKIQRVPEHLRNRENIKEHYLPRLLSIGPIHHGSPNLKLGEKYKLMMAAKYIIQSNRLNGLNREDLHKKIADNIHVLKDHYDQDVLTSTEKSLDGFRNLDEKLSWMLFVDGCSLMWILSLDVRRDFKADQVILLMFQDVILLENQLPYLVLKLLWVNDDEAQLMGFIDWFVRLHQLIPPKFREDENELKDTMMKTWWSNCFSVLRRKKNNHPPQLPVSMPNESEPVQRKNEKIHLLHFCRTIILTQSPSKPKSNEANNMNLDHERGIANFTYRNVQDLRAAGIKFESSGTRNPLDINYSEGWFAGKLFLPEIVVNHMTAAFFHNLIAYEMCPDFKNDYEICSFASFMDRIIDYPEDVKELRSKGILINRLGSDEEVANFFNILCTDLVEGKIYNEVNKNIEKHYKNKFKTCIAQGIHGSFSSIWTTIGFLAAFIALALTFTQTWFAVHPAS